MAPDLNSAAVNLISLRKEPQVGLPSEQTTRAQQNPGSGIFKHSAFKNQPHQKLQSERFSSKFTPPYLLEHFFVLVSGSHQFLNEAIREVPTEHVRHQEGRLLHGPADPREARTAMSRRLTTVSQNTGNARQQQLPRQKSNSKAPRYSTQQF